MVTSYYGRSFHGRRTASGEIYDKNELTCAHKSLPFQTLLKITNPKNGKSVVVRVNDRGPFKRGRQLDISYSAARELDMLAAGVLKLQVEIILPEQIAKEPVASSEESNRS
ncbi:MAG: septal ring lytic transglycosylase RlpA family protein [Candidatus Cloacimonadota bacterium]|nr:septal ring lytic transglycosylase RlpA family protein [Candidatus Cloacimonadota bacterium]NMD11913.1 septal ring lytic transglycosylase RlpA family protein [Candidatus Cloacimonadota bacterium]